MLGCGEWTTQIVGRGGSPVRVEFDYTSLSVGKVLNDAGAARASIPNLATSGASCCEVFDACEPWRDEVVCYRGDHLAYAGPLITMSAGSGGGSLSSSDLFTWMENRFVPDFHGDGDCADVFHDIFDLALGLDPSPNIDITTRQTGVEAVQDFNETDFHKAADALRELARSGLDFTMVGRRLLAGGKEVFLSEAPLILHDEGVTSVEVIREGANLATDVGVRGAVNTVGSEPAFGRATSSIERYGLIQRSFAELLGMDRISLDANAAARLRSMQPAPIRVKATLSPDAAFTYEDAIPGRRIDMHLEKAAGCIEVMGEMRLTNVNAEVGKGTEAISIEAIPVGVSDA